MSRTAADDDASSVTGSVASTSRGKGDGYTWQTVESGFPGTLDYRMRFRDRLGRTCSPWHNIPLYSARTGNVHAVCKTPKRTWARLEVSQDEDFTPLRSESKGESPARFQSNCPWNLTMIPQTYANPHQLNLDYIGLKYDGRPLDLIDIGRKRRRRGQVYAVKVLAAFALVDLRREMLTWKLVGVAADDRKAGRLDDMADIHWTMPGTLEEVREWLRTCQVTHEGDREFVFGLNERASDRALASTLIAQSYLSWQQLAKSTRPREPAFLDISPTDIISSFPSSAVSDSDASSVFSAVEDDLLGFGGDLDSLPPGAIPISDPTAQVLMRRGGDKGKKKGSRKATQSVVALRGSDDEEEEEAGGQVSEDDGSDTERPEGVGDGVVSVSCSRRELMRFLKSSDPRLSRPAFIQFMTQEQRDLMAQVEGQELQEGLGALVGKSLRAVDEEEEGSSSDGEEKEEHEMAQQGTPVGKEEGDRPSPVSEGGGSWRGGSRFGLRALKASVSDASEKVGRSRSSRGAAMGEPSEKGTGWLSPSGPGSKSGHDSDSPRKKSSGRGKGEGSKDLGARGLRRWASAKDGNLHDDDRGDAHSEGRGVEAGGEGEEERRETLGKKGERQKEQQKGRAEGPVLLVKGRRVAWDAMGTNVGAAAGTKVKLAEEKGR